ncbi:NADH-quinone oxidoreductase subunit I [Planctomycetota bacterium]|nr:NADH-quinone oxidoreductase subunit I [Planctomycetota bacterium]
MAKVVPRPELNFWERIYFIEIFKGLATTLGHARKGLTDPAHFPTVNYPEEKPELPRDYRARHRLMKRADGSPRCVACYMCSTACPARCINIVAETSPDRHIEKRPVKFEIDLLLCVFCGYCVEACPCDAIRMDTKLGVMVHDNRADFVIDKTKLMDWDPKDYPVDDLTSQSAPGGARHADALARLQSGSDH